ncbi:hypothetical protein ACMFMG_008111 [Clarireedia jacksonii]
MDLKTLWKCIIWSLSNASQLIVSKPTSKSESVTSTLPLASSALPVIPPPTKPLRSWSIQNTLIRRTTAPESRHLLH